LDVITERLRLAKIRNASITEVPQVPKETPPPPAPVPEEPAAEVSQPPAQAKAQEHPLQHRWTLYHDTKTRSQVPFTPFTGSSGEQTPFTQTSTESGAYEAGLTTVGEFSTVEGFCRYFNWIKPPSKLDKNSNYHLFKDGIKPMWEDPANSQGGKWVITMKNNPALLDRCWQWLVMALIGEELDERDEVCGAVVSLRSKIDRIQLWTRGKDDVEKINSLGKRLVKVLDVAEEPGIGLEFQYNTDERPPANKFLSMQATYPQTAFGGSFGRAPNTASGGAFSPGGAGGYGQGQQQHHAMTASVGGTFNDGGFGGGPGWKPRKE
jgi:translation initiation factor 4E